MFDVFRKSGGKKDTPAMISSIIDEIERAWNKQSLSSTKGFVEVVPENQSKDNFRELHIHYESGSKVVHKFNVQEFKEWKNQKMRRLGLPK